MYHCAQNTLRQHAPSKNLKENAKHRNKDSMDTFECQGWLHITLSDLSDIALIKLHHHEDHIPYCPIDIPLEVEEYVKENSQLTSTQVSPTIQQPDARIMVTVYT
jgi:hypothetical protein